ncbi:MAG: pyridoxal phosphate-dependent aminotransferase [Pseudobdellovibrionaceae bacterium]|nr:pyridoxal phosphate-dependent aminotransferase [Pseudobdellovibrionaceae bacterium]
MELSLSKRISQLQPSPTVALNTKAKELAEQGHKVINFSVGEPDFTTPKPIVDVAIEALNQGKTKYSAAGGSLPLRKAISQKLEKDNKLNYPPSQIVAGVGAKEILFHLSLALINEGDEVLIPAPYWVSYTEHVVAAGGKPVVIPFPRDHHAPRLTPEMIQPYVTPRTKAIIITTPNNPAGYTIPEAELRQLGQYLQDKPWWIIADEIYEYMSYDFPAVSMATLCPGLKDRYILVNGLSKGYAMTGWRVGYMAGPSQVAEMVRTLQTQSSTCLPAFVEEAAVKALSMGPDATRDKMGLLKSRRDMAIRLLREMPGVDMMPPNGAFYIFIDIRKVLAKSPLYANDNSLAFSAKLLEAHHVAMVPGEAFGAPGFLRLSYAVADEQLIEGLKRLGEALKAV